MAASDPTPGVATPTGVLQGVAAFSWDGTNWQPSAGAGPDVATPTGVLRGVAPFAWDGAAWQPSGRAKPGVAAPGGVLDGVAVYTWSGSAWTPASGQPTPSTPSGALRGVAAFSWDGSAWQPAGQAGPSVATPYGVLGGVAFFNWSGSTWQAGAAVPAGATLDLSFMSGTLDPRLTFTRASTATYFDVTGTMQTAAINTPRFDYDPVTHAALGLLIEEQRTNVALQSADLSNVVWVAQGTAPPTKTANAAIAPDGTTTACRIAYPLVSGASAAGEVTQTITVTANPYAYSMYLRGNVGGEKVWIMTTTNAVTWYSTPATLTTAWQRFVVNTPALTATTWYFALGVDLRDGTQTTQPAQTVFAWGGQVEQGAFPTSYIPTTGAAVTRSIDAASMSVAAWYNAAAGSLMAEYATGNVPDTSGINRDAVCVSDGTVAHRILLRALRGGQSNALVNTVAAGTVNLVLNGTVTANAPTKIATSLDGTTIAGTCNGTTIVSNLQSTPAGMTTVTIGDLIGNTETLNGYIRRVRYWPRVLSNAELQSVTT